MTKEELDKLLNEDEVEVTKVDSTDLSEAKKKGMKEEDEDEEMDDDETKKKEKAGEEVDEAAPTTKPALMAAAYKKMSKLEKSQVTEFYNILMGISEKETVTEEKKEINPILSESLNNLDDLMNLKEDLLDESTKNGIKEIFENAVEASASAKVAEEVKSLEESSVKAQEDAIEKHIASLDEQVNSYLDYLAENWLKENQVAVDTTLKGEILEGFVQKLHTAFTESYIEVPEGKEDLVESLTDEVSELEGQNAKYVEELIEQKAEVIGLKRAAIISEATSTLTESQVLKVTELSEDVDFVDETQFKGQIQGLIKVHLNETTAEIDDSNKDLDDLTEEAETPKVSSEDAIAKAIIEAGQ